MKVGVISDTHGLLRPEALAALEGVDHILHAGDVGAEGIVERLEEIAPVTAIRGNVDTAPWATWPEEATLDLAGCRIRMLHDVKTLEGAAGADVLIFGHSHKPGQERRDGTLRLNPGSAGRRRFRLPVTLALLRLADGRAEAEILDLLPQG
ncbi:metallophosphoesterase family protein [Pseudoroseicyclus aestuarii]|uniref:Phosphoesterase n=1 Tax=Pseudoroseicyclus aestuarii TaxID=1795041 RepID=A0A318SUJ3_9RHOB|nr:metallophosphoesterase family protein [Pseudoroseicyclus aestuarii]PYE83916.1 hypothetical protein DFP88_103277 [Pseudoroseicyclus aestuarii]